LRGLASVLNMSSSYGYDPTRVALAGDSDGAFKAMIGALGYGHVLAGDQDSGVKWILNHRSPVDIRGDSTTGYFTYKLLGDILGTRADVGVGAGTEFDNLSAELKRRLSIRWYYETGQISGHPGLGRRNTNG